MIQNFLLPDGTQLNKLGCGTWNMGDDKNLLQEEITTLRYGIEHGLNVIDTAEMYGDGRSEILVGQALSGLRDQVFLTSKFVPSHANSTALIKSCRASLKRLKTDYLDLYLLHWASSTPLIETIETLEYLKKEGLIRYWGVSNFDLPDMEVLCQTKGGRSSLTDQVLFNLNRREAEYRLVGYLEKNDMFATAYSPLGQGGSLLKNEVLAEIGKEHILSNGHHASAAQIALAWVLAQRNILAIPKAVRLDHMKANILAQEIVLTDQDYQKINNEFPPPVRQERLHII